MVHVKTAEPQQRDFDFTDSPRFNGFASSERPFSPRPSNFVASEQPYSPRPSGFVASERPFSPRPSDFVGPEFTSSERGPGFAGSRLGEDSGATSFSSGIIRDDPNGFDVTDRSPGFGVDEPFDERRGPIGSERTPFRNPGASLGPPQFPSLDRSTATTFLGSNGRGLFGARDNLEEDNGLGKTVNVGYGPNYFAEFGGFGGGRQQQCLPRPQCQKSKYRTIDGSCNNLRNPLWGAAGTPYGRLLPPKYADGVHAPPRSVLGAPLPEPRLLSRLFLPTARKDDEVWTLVFMQWGQIITHDMSLAMDTLPNPRAPECCSPQAGPLFRKLSKGEPCYPVTVQRDDPLFLKYRQTCMDFLRTTTDQQNGCRASKHANPLSATTHWLDGSTVYGPDEETLSELRAYEGGLLRVEVRAGKTWPPSDRNTTRAGCIRPAPQQVCYRTGDVRVNQNPGLAMLQIVLMREHNRLAQALNQINPQWDDERLFQETRRIVIAEIQHITYYQWLQAFMGKESMRHDGLSYPGRGAYVNDYDEQVNPSVLNEHAQGAFRFLHTNIQGQLVLMSERRYSQGHIRLSEHMQDVSILETPAFEDLARGMTTQAQHAVDRFHTKEITENLFRRPENPAFGFDLKSLDVQRGRDHGLASYNDYRAFCGFPRATTFQDFTDLMDSEDAQRLSHVYRHPDDVDLSVGGALEGGGPEGPAGVGPTFSCILSEQFFRTRVADRFFFERGDHPAAFTPEQLTEIRKSNMARLMCDNADDVHTMQPKAFFKLSKTNPLMPCAELDSIPTINLDAWRETRRGKFVTHYRPDFS